VSRHPPGAEEVLWHDVECGGYNADLPLWRELADAEGDPVLEIGAGTGRVALDLARRGHDVTALDHDARLLDALRERAAAAGRSVTTLVADARDFDAGRRFALCLVPMQTLQLLGGRPGRRRLWRRARAHLEPGGLLAAAIAVGLESYAPERGDDLPLPDVREVEGWVLASQPVAIRPQRHGTTIERVRQLVAPDGRRTQRREVVRLDRLDAATAAAEAEEAGLAALPPREIPDTPDHLGSEVVLLRAPG
jgi:SAM-dependent methyltransferase